MISCSQAYHWDLFFCFRQNIKNLAWTVVTKSSLLVSPSKEQIPLHLPAQSSCLSQALLSPVLTREGCCFAGLAQCSSSLTAVRGRAGTLGTTRINTSCIWNMGMHRHIHIHSLRCKNISRILSAFMYVSKINLTPAAHHQQMTLRSWEAQRH